MFYSFPKDDFNRFRVAVIDSSVFIKKKCIYKLAERFATTRDILSECRSVIFERSGSVFSNVRVLDPNHHVAKKEVSRVAFMSDRFRNLSSPDVRLVALSCELEEAAHGSMHLRIKLKDCNLFLKHALIKENEEKLFLKKHIINKHTSNIKKIGSFSEMNKLKQNFLKDYSSHIIK